jgi:ABC-type nitrate/sulfonate/bicarbonate transport system permease component
MASKIDATPSDLGRANGRTDARRGPSADTIRRVPGPAERDPKGHQAKRRWLERTLAFGIPVILLGVWQWTSHAKLINPQFFPPPTAIWNSGVSMIRSGTLQSNLWVSTRRVLEGFALGVGSGILVGLLMGMSRTIRAALDGLLSALYTVPKLALLPLLLLIFGIGETPQVLVIALTVFFFMWISTMAAIIEVNEGYREAVRSFGGNQFQLFRHALLPASLPQIFVGLRISAGVSVLVMVGTEYVEGNSGIGHLIWFSWSLFLASQMYVGIVMVALMGLLFTMIVRAVGRWVSPWAARDSRGVGAGY